MNALDTFFFGLFPYIALTIFLVGSLLRFDRDQYTWKADSSQMLRTGSLRWGSNLFHIGVLFLFFGHAVGMLTPHAVYEHFISAGDKQLMAMITGGIAGLLGFVGVSLLLHRRLTDPRIRATSRTSDILLLVLLWVQLALGLASIPLSAQHLDGGLMMKFEWPLMLPDDASITALSARTKDVAEYVVELSKTYGLVPGLTPVAGGVTFHHACHARAQNMGAKSMEMLKLIPGLKVDIVERCSGHGGTFGVMKGTHEVANKVGRPAARQVIAKGNETLCSDCPLACKHMVQLIADDTKVETPAPVEAHPIEVMARAYGVM